MQSQVSEAKDSRSEDPHARSPALVLLLMLSMWLVCINVGFKV